MKPLWVKIFTRTYECEIASASYDQLEEIDININDEVVELEVCRDKCRVELGTIKSSALNKDVDFPSDSEEDSIVSPA